METRTQAHVCYRLLYHVVWIPKKRWNVLKTGVNVYLEKVIRSFVLDRYPGVVVEEIAIQEDHVHIVMVIPPKYGISRVIGEVKSVSSRKLREKFEYLKEVGITFGQLDILYHQWAWMRRGSKGT